MIAETYTAQDFANEVDVSRETFEAFSQWHALLLKWNRKINLVSPTALNSFWQRHALDSWQVTRHLRPEDYKILDLGSGAGFPGLALAIHMKQKNNVTTNAKTVFHVKLVESAGKKANFLRTVIRELNLPASVWAGRAEDLEALPYDVISARAFAPLPRLLTYAQPFWGATTQALLLKGQSVDSELTEAEKSWTFDITSSPSHSHEGGSLLSLTALRAKPE
ncbi:MAG: 16S rRNA (guanine(527)-N(7))-methyltransferase RsmG [Maricaulaceae bacterium]